MFETVLEEAFLLILIVSGIPLVISSAAGLVVATLQTATQIQEQSISFVVKFICVSAVLALLGSWFMQQILTFMREMISAIGVIK